MGVIDGTAVSALITNAAFLEKNADSTGIGEVTLASTSPTAGAQVDSLQMEHNSAASFMGKTLNSASDDLPAWGNTDVGTATDTLFARTDAITERFNETTGHKHDGTAGNGAPVSSGDLINTPLRGFVLQATDIIGATGSSTVVTSNFIAKTPGGSTVQEGVVTDPPYNRVIVRQATGANQDDSFTDAFGNIVFARITYSAGVWTLSYFVIVSGTETVYSFASASDVRYYYQEIHNPLLPDAPVYSEFAVVPSDNQTSDVIQATTTLQGKVSLASSAPGAIASTGSAGTGNAVVANANHTHEGLHSVMASGYSQLLGDAIIAGSNGAVVTQASQTITISAPALTSSAPSDVGSSASVGSATTSAKADHVHRGVSSFAKSGDTALYGAVTISASGGVTLTQAAQNVAIDAPALSSTAPSDVGSSAVTGTGTTSARADHAHRGVFSVHKTGSSQIFGEITLSQTGGVTITQSSNDLSIDAPALSSTAPADIGSSASVGSGTTAAKADHVHRGVLSVNKNGATTLYGAVTLSAGTNITLAQVGQDISIASTASGGGGGGSLTFYDTASPEIIDQPAARILNRGAKFAFDPCSATTDNQVVFVDFRVPTSYTAGGPINLKLAVYTPSTSGTVAFTVISYLVRTGTDSYTAPTLTTTTAVSVAASTANKLVNLTALIAPAGSLGAAVSAGDMIRVGIRTNYPTHTITGIAYLVASSTEVTFT